MFRHLAAQLGKHVRPAIAPGMKRQVWSSALAVAPSFQTTAGVPGFVKHSHVSLYRVMRMGGGGGRCLSTQPSIGSMHAVRPASRLFGSQRRCLSTSPSGRYEQAREGVEWLRTNRVLLGVVGGAFLVMYGFYRISIRLMTFFLNVPPQQIFTAGMAVGAATTVRQPTAKTTAPRTCHLASGRLHDLRHTIPVPRMCMQALAVIGLRTGRRYILVRIDDVFDAANKAMRTEPARSSVKKALGEFWRPGKFRGYALEALGDATLGSERRARSSYFQVPSQRVQMIFEVKGLDHRGIVSLEAYKRRGEYQFEMLSLDVPATGEHLLIAGSKDRVLFPEIVSVLEGAKKQSESKYNKRS